MDAFWVFASSHLCVGISVAFFGGCIAWTLSMAAAASVYSIAGVPKLLLFSLPNRLIQSSNIKARGWPPEHLDADGDYHTPKREDEEAT